VKLWIHNELQISAFSTGIANRPNCLATGRADLFKGTCALTEFKVEALDAQQPTNKVSVKFAKVTGRL